MNSRTCYSDAALCLRLAIVVLLASTASAPAATLTWTGLGDGQTFSQLANWQGTPTGGAIDVANLVDTYVLNSPATINNVFNNLEFTNGGRLEMSAGTLDTLMNGNYGLGRVEEPSSFGSLLLTGGHVSTRYLAEMNVALNGNAILTLSGPNDPVNTSTVDLLGPGVVVHFLNETPSAFVSEHLAKFMVQGTPAIVSQNLLVIDDGNTGSLVTPLITSGSAVQLLVDRDTGNLSISNTTNQAVEFFQYDIISSVGALDETLWTPIAARLDAPGNGGNGLVDPDDAWLRFTQPSSRTDLAEGTLGHAVLASGQAIDLGNAWIASPFEDLAATLSLANGTDLPLEVVYSGSQLADTIEPGDFNADGRIDTSDWPFLRDHLFSSVANQLLVDAHAAGDIDLNGRVDEQDFAQFVMTFEAQNGVGAFSLLLAEIPEPGAACLCVLAVVASRLANPLSRFGYRPPQAPV